MAAAALIAAGLVAASPTSASAGPPPQCRHVNADWSGVVGNRLNLHGECESTPAVLGAHVFANGVEVGQPGSGSGFDDWTHTCKSRASTDWLAVWNTGEVTEGVFNCG